MCSKAPWEEGERSNLVFEKKEEKNISPFFDASGNKNIGATIRIGQEICTIVPVIVNDPAT